MVVALQGIIRTPARCHADDRSGDDADTSATSLEASLWAGHSPARYRAQRDSRNKLRWHMRAGAAGCSRGWHRRVCRHLDEQTFRALSKYQFTLCPGEACLLAPVSACYAWFWNQPARRCWWAEGVGNPVHTHLVDLKAWAS